MLSRRYALAVLTAATMLGSGCAPAHVTRFQTAMLSPVQSDANEFEDERLRMRFAVYQDAIALRITNKTKAPLKISWSECTYMDVYGQLHGVSHTNLRPTGMQSTAAFTLIPPEGRLDDSITLFTKILPSGLYAPPEPLFDSPALDGRPVPFDEFKKGYTGKSFALLVMVRTDDAAVPYRFRFKIKDLQPQAGPPAVN